MHGSYTKAGITLLCIALVLGALAGCPMNSVTNPTVNTGLYMTDTFSGKVYTYNPNDHTVSSTSFVSTGQNSTGAIYFYKGIGYVAVGSGTNTAPGVYYFNPSDSVPQAVRIGSTNRSAQYIAFYSPTKAYVTMADFVGTPSEQGVYTFNPSNPSAGLSSTPITGTNGSLMFLQQIVVGPDNKVYVANNSALGGTDQVLQIDPSFDTLSATTFTASKGGTTALVSGAYGGIAGVFVGNSPFSPPGSVDFINTTSLTISPVALLSSIAASRLLYLSSGKLVTTSFTDSYILSDTNGTPSRAPLGSSLGGADIAAKDGLIYVGYTDYLTSKLYVFDASGGAESYSPLSVMGTGECVAGLAFYHN